jgi:dihydrofolate reductase
VITRRDPRGGESLLIHVDIRLCLESQRDVGVAQAVDVALEVVREGLGVTTADRTTAGETHGRRGGHRRELQMRRILVVENVTLDGVMQAPGSPDEDTSGGFRHGGWALPYMDDVIGREMSKGMGATELLFGRRTYEQFYSYWPTAPQPNPFTDVLNNTQKYVASTTLREPLAWVNSTLVAGDAGKAVADLKQQPGKDLVVLGSGELVQSLMEHGVVDEYTLLIHPLVLGSGRRLFREGASTAKLRLTRSVTTTTGVVIGVYQAADRVEP